MKEIMNYIDSSLEGLPEDKYLYHFRKKIVNEITARANEITHTGIDDEKVINDIIKDQYPDLRKEFEDFRDDIFKKRTAKSRRRKAILGSVIYFTALILVFLLVSFITKGWNRSWIFLVNGVCLFIAYISIAAVMALSEKPGRIKPVSRALLAISIFNFALPVFLIAAFLLRISHPWLVFLIAALVMLAVDGIFVQKINNRFAIFFQLFYIIPAMVILYFLLGTLRVVPWHPGWLMIPAAFLIILVVIGIRIAIHNKQDNEFDEAEGDREWNAD